MTIYTLTIWIRLLKAYVIQFTFNIVTSVMKSMCQGGLNIEIDPKPTICNTNAVSHKIK